MRQAGPGICKSKYVEDAKDARSVRVWDMKERGGMPEGVTGHHQMPGRSWRAVTAIAAMESP